MSIADLKNDPLTIDDAEDAVASFTEDSNEPAVLALMRPGDALARFMLDVSLTPHLRRLLKTPSRLVLIKTEDEEQAELLERYIGHMDRAPVVEVYTELRKSSGKLQPHGRTELSSLERGRGVVLISQDPERILVSEALAAADAVITVPHPDLAVVRKSIRAVTGTVARGLRCSDIEGLGILDLITAIRPGMTAHQCVMNLRRAALIRRVPPQDNHAIALEDLAMTKAVSDWAFETLRIMGQVRDGMADAPALRYGCLEGPPGTGKTTIAGSLAHSAHWNFVSTSVGKWFAESGGHLGDVIRAARTFFDEVALAKGPVVGLLDEIDALPNRATMNPDGASWWTPVITFVLTEIDRVRKSGKPVLLVAATNHFDHLDSALIRPGRLERKVSVLPPNEAERRAMFAGFLGKRIADQGLASLARLSVRATPAQIESWCKSAIAASESRNRPLELGNLIDLIAPVGGRSPDKDRAIAIHEAGHAIVAHELGLPVEEISILGAGAVGGWVNTNHQNRPITRDEVERIVTMGLAGRAADVALGGGAHAGAASDIENVNALLRSAMLEFGLYDSLTTSANSDLRNWRNQGLSLGSTIGQVIDRLHDRATAIVNDRRDDILTLVDALLTERVVTGERLAEILKTGAATSARAGTLHDAENGAKASSQTDTPDHSDRSEKTCSGKP